MKKFMDKDFLLETETAKVLYHDHAAKMPICDFHNHLNVQEIYEDKVFNDIGEIWLGGDHYKWRALRTNGIQEEYVTGKEVLSRKNSANGLKQFHIHSGIHCITGHIWNCSVILELKSR